MAMTMTNDDLHLQTTEVDNQDIKQEATLREWLTGKKQSQRIIYQELASGDRVLYFGSYHKDLDQAELPWSDGSSKIDPAVIERLIDWTFEQPQSIQIVVFSFLDSEDKETLLPSVLKRLGLNRLTTEAKAKRKNVVVSAAEIMRNNLPASKDDLIRLVQSISPETKRPAAAVRQFLRQETRKGKVYYLPDDDRYYHVQKDL